MRSAPKLLSHRPRVLFTIVSGAVLINPAFAQSPESEELEEVVVTGLRGSLTTSRDIKRDAIGIVDAINAEDMGKFPDANLSESLQRITGLSIDRRNGEGALVTARGFGSQLNMVTLNGRTMPAADAFGGGGNGNDGGVAGQTRAFNFANLASENISGIEVYKTSKANIATGGIGATINVKTARPLDSDGLAASVTAKAVTDTAEHTGDDFTPEVSGIFSFTDDAKTWGVGLAASYQERHSGSASATVNDWNIRTWTDNPDDLTTSLAPGATITNAPADGALYAIPNDIRYHFSDRQRTRTNAQLTLQFSPVDSLTFTGDYTYARNELIEDRGDQTTWFNANRFNLIEFDAGQAVATPLVIREDEGTAKDFGFEQQHREQTNELNSIGLNADWQITERFRLTLDVHDSTSESLPSDPVTGGGETLFSMAARMPSTCDPVGSNNCTNRFEQTFRFSDGLPLAQLTHFPSPTTSASAGGGDPDFGFTEEHLGSQYLRVNYEEQTTDITQARLDGELSFDNGRFQFGVETRAMESHQRASNAQMSLGDWGVASPGELPSDLLSVFSLAGNFDDFPTPGVSPGGWRGDANSLAEWAVQEYGVWRDPTNTNGVLSYNPGFNQDHVIEEDIQAVYFQFGMQGELGSMPVNVLAGLRYERTDVTAVSQLIVPTGLLWQDNNDMSVIRGTEFTPFSQREKYDHLLPNLDFDIELREGLKGRFSYSKTIARAQYNQLRSAVAVQTAQGSSLNGFLPTANGSNPALVPLESDNLDLSLEWYIGDSSYVSAGVFEKRVSNFIGNEVSPENLFDIRNQTAGPRALAAVEALDSAGFGADDTNLFVMMTMMENPGSFTDQNGVTWTGGAENFDGTEAQHLAFAAQYDLRPDSSDPLYTFSVSRPVNNKEAKIHGWEFAGQHFFGDSGFGFLANYTIVRGDVGFDDGGDPNVNQFALVGLSDSANLVLMYEKYGFAVRLAYNWRDEFLQNANVGNFRSPQYVEEYEQIDLSIGYDINDHLSLTFEGLNLTEEDVRWHGRSTGQMWFLQDQGARYSIGARYKF